MNDLVHPVQMSCALPHDSHDGTAAQRLSNGIDTVSVQRISGSQQQAALDHVVQEMPVALVYNGISHAVMMATPTDIALFAKGFSLSEGILSSLKELYALDIQQTALGIQVDMTISSRAFAALKQQRRSMVGRTGCGLCGIESLQQLQHGLAQVSTPLDPLWLQHIPQAVAALSNQQSISQVTGGAHAAAWVVQGEVIALYEDAGRHNALDKLLGHLAQTQVNLASGFVLMTSRASYELIRKCAQLNIALLASISAPTSMAISLAKQAGLMLASFCRGNGYVLYNEVAHRD